MTGIGDQITSLTLSTATRPDANILLANPMIPLATKDVFATLHSANQDQNQDQNQGHAGDISQLDATALVGLGNDLAETAIELVPEIASLLTLLQQQRGCQVAAMSGSGASCFALFETEAQAQAAAELFPKMAEAVWLGPAS